MRVSQDSNGLDKAPGISLVQIASLILLGVVALTILFWRLGEASLEDWDEAIYAQVSKEIVTRGDWITLHWSYENWFHKPPLFFWMTAVFLGFLA